MWDAELLYRELPATRGAGIPEVWVSAKGRATGFSSHPLSYDKGEFPAMAVIRAVSSHRLVNQRTLRNERPCRIDLKIGGQGGAAAGTDSRAGVPVQVPVCGSWLVKSWQDARAGSALTPTLHGRSYLGHGLGGLGRNK